MNYSSDGKKFYIQSLEGGNTLVFDALTKKKIKSIKHEFTAANQNLFKDGESNVFDYKYNLTKANYNIFTGKPVESCFSHNGKYLWVTYYRRNYDSNASCPSAVAIIDTEKDIEISNLASTTVNFSTMSEAEISDYVASGEPLGVAGGFTLDRLSSAFISSIDGDYTNVIGLSIPLLRAMTNKLGYSWPDLKSQGQGAKL